MKKEKLDLTKRYFIIGQYSKNDKYSYIITQKSIICYDVRIKPHNVSKITDEYYLKNTYTLEEAEKILKKYRKYVKHSKSSWIYKPINFLLRASKFK